MSVLGLIFADSYDADLGSLVEKRCMAALPFGGRYRMIDFMLSNMVHADIRNIGIIMTQKYHSLMRHVRAGSAWDLDRKRSGITYLPPFATESVSKNVYENRLEAMQANLDFFENADEDYVLFTSCNYAANLDLNKMIEFHKNSGAKITGLYTTDPVNKQPEIPVTEYKIDDDNNITGVRIAPGLMPGMEVAANTYIIDREELIKALVDTMERGEKSFRRNVLQREIEQGNVKACRTESTMLFIDDMSSYMKSCFELLNPEIREEIFRADRPVITRVKDSAPTRYGSSAKAVNSLIADGCVIDGEVRNSVIFRGVHIKKGAVVENSVIMQDAMIDENASLNYTLLDKYTHINEGRVLSGYITHPFYAGHRTII